MAEAARSNLSNKLRITVGYRDAQDKEKKRKLNFKNLNEGIAAQTLFDAAKALAGLQMHGIVQIAEVTENTIEG